MKKRVIKIVTAVLLFILLLVAVFFTVRHLSDPHRRNKDIEVKAATYVGLCGENIKWNLNTLTGTLELEGKGEFNDYSSPDDIPWCNYSKYIKEVTVENGITEIAPYLFYRSKELVSIKIPRSVKSIGEYAFFGCSSLLSVEFSENSNLKTINESAFAYCRSLNKFEFPTRVSSIEKNAFLCCYSLSDMTLGYSVTNIGEGAFSSCSGMKKLRIVNYDCNIFDDGETVYRNIKIEGFSSSTAKEYAEKYLRTYSIIKDMKNINDLDVKLSFTECVYNGKKKKPDVKIKGLKNGTDYTVNYTKNTEPGIASVTVSAAGSTLGEVTLDFLIKPQKPKSLRVREVSENSMTLTWNAVHGASGYELYQKINNKWKKVATTTENYAEIKRLTGATNYKFKVRAFTSVDGEKVKSKFSSVYKSATRPEKVKITSVTNRGIGRLTVSWNRAKNADGYIIYISTKKKSGFKEVAVVNSSSRVRYVIQNLKSNKKYYVTVKSFVKNGKSKVISESGNVVSKSTM